MAVMPPRWRFVLTTLSGTAIGQINDAYERQVVRTLSGTSTASLKLPVNTDFLADLLTRDLNLKAYRDRKLMFHGPIITSEFVVPDQNNPPSLAVAAADPSWRLARRLSGKSAAGTLYNGVDRLTIAEGLILTLNGETNGETGIQLLGQTCGSTAVYVAGPYKKTEDCIRDMSQTLDGFDWKIEPIEYSSGKIGQFKAAATLGTSRPDAVFEYQGRGNMRVPTYKRDLSTVANKVYHIHDSGPNVVDGVLSKADTTSQVERGLYEDIAEAGGLTNTTLRNSLLDDHIMVRKNPRQILTFSPDFDDYTGRVPAYGTEYEIGDLIRGRVLYNGVVIVDGTVRLYRMQFDIDNNDRETLTPTVVDE